MYPPRLRTALAIGFALTTALTISQVALAAPTAKERADARALSNDGRKALREKRFADAITSLKKADRLDPNAALEVDLASAQIGAGKLVEASKTLGGIVAGTEPTPAARRARDIAKKMLADLKSRIPTVRVSVKGAPADKATALVDGIEVDASSDVPVNPGDHTVSATAEGFSGADKDVRLAEGAHESVSLKLRSKRPKGDGDDGPKQAGSRVPGAVVTTIGGLGLVVGGIFGGLAFSATSKAKALCAANICPPTAADQISKSKLYGNVSTGMFVGGGVVAVTGIILIAVAPGGGSKSDDGAKSARVAPWLGPGTAGLGATGRF